MRRILAILTTLLMLCGCSQSDSRMDQALSMRDAILSGNGCQFGVTITADYQDVYYVFAMDCHVDSTGKLTFEVKEPETICGITGIISAEEGKLTFDDKVLIFATMAEGYITPVSAPWLFINALRGGFIKGCAQEDNGILITIDDSYMDEAIQLNIRTVDDVPVFTEIIWKNRRVVTMNVETFRFL